MWPAGDTMGCWMLWGGLMMILCRGGLGRRDRP